MKRTDNEKGWHLKSFGYRQYQKNLIGFRPTHKMRGRTGPSGKVFRAESFPGICGRKLSILWQQYIVSGSGCYLGGESIPFSKDCFKHISLQKICKDLCSGPLIKYQNAVSSKPWGIFHSIYASDVISLAILTY